LLATVAGIVAVTVFWIGGRQREIGVRRALGASKLEIAAHILAENFFIVSVGVVAGAALAFVTNILLMHYLEMSALPSFYIGIGGLAVLILGQCSALAPARRAAEVSPLEATRLTTARN
jgi:putative ABC transport system permease protein